MKSRSEKNIIYLSLNKFLGWYTD